METQEDCPALAALVSSPITAAANGRKASGIAVVLRQRGILPEFFPLRAGFPAPLSLTIFASLFSSKLVRSMPKAKTHKGMAKRFKVTGSGTKATHRSANRGHILGKKSGKRKRHLRNGGVLSGTNARMIVAALRPGM